MANALGGTLIILAATLAARSLPAQTTERLSESSGGVQGNGASIEPVVSADGRYVAFESWADNLVPGDTNLRRDVFVHDRLTGTTSRASVASDGNQSAGESYSAAISADGRYVAFVSHAGDLAPGATGGLEDVFLRDLLTGTTECVSVPTPNRAGGFQPRVSGDGRYVAFSTWLQNTPAPAQAVYVRDRQLGTTAAVSVGLPGNLVHGADPSISSNGRYIAFRSLSADLVPGDTNGVEDVFVRDRIAGTTLRASVATGGGQADGASDSPAISADGVHVAYLSYATNLVPSDTNGSRDVFVHDRTTGTTERVSLTADGSQGDADSFRPALSADGRYLSFGSVASNLVPEPGFGLPHAYLRDRLFGLTIRTSVAWDGTPGNLATFAGSISADGRHVVFDSLAQNLVPASDTNGTWDVFVRDRATCTGAVEGPTPLVLTRCGSTQGVYQVTASGSLAGGSWSAIYAPGFPVQDGWSVSVDPQVGNDATTATFSAASTSTTGAGIVRITWTGTCNGWPETWDQSVSCRLLEACPLASAHCLGDGSGTPCPCNNLGAAGQGCANSTGQGARLGASGSASIAAADLVLSATGLVPLQGVLYLQGTTLLNGGQGVAFGDGLRCAGGSGTRLQVLSSDASGASSTTIDIAATGAVSPGDTRSYQLWYRDPLGSPCGSEFNLTNGLQLTWQL